MAGYTVKNLKQDVDDAAQKFGLSPNLEAHFGREPLGCSNVGVTYQRIAPGFRVPFAHRHTEQEEVYVLVAGSARVKVEDEIVELCPWDALRVSPEVARNFEA